MEIAIKDVQVETLREALKENQQSLIDKLTTVDQNVSLKAVEEPRERRGAAGMEIAIQDVQVETLRRALKENQQSLLEKLTTLDQKRKENVFLKAVYDDYKEHYEYIVEQKRKQKEQLEMLMNYLEKTMLEAGLSDAMIRQTKHQQQNILGELDKLRDDIHTIINHGALKPEK
jgi:sulfite reductase beta subunit-like hemoprotein